MSKRKRVTEVVLSGQPFDVYIGRNQTRHSVTGRVLQRTPYAVWGNPFRIGPDGTRDEVVAKHRAWFWDQITTGRQNIRALAMLHGQRLRCHCKTAEAPNTPCHGDTLVAASEWIWSLLSPAKRAEIERVQLTEFDGDYVPPTNGHVPSYQGQPPSADALPHANRYDPPRGEAVPSYDAYLEGRSSVESLSYEEASALRDQVREDQIVAEERLYGGERIAVATDDGFDSGWSQISAEFDVELERDDWRMISSAYANDVTAWLVDQNSEVLIEDFSRHFSVAKKPPRDGGAGSLVRALSDLCDRLTDHMLDAEHGIEVDADGIAIDRSDQDALVERNRADHPTEPSAIEPLSTGLVRAPVRPQVPPYHNEIDLPDIRPLDPMRRFGDRVAYRDLPNPISDRFGPTRRDRHEAMLYIARHVATPGRPADVIRYIDRVLNALTNEPAPRQPIPDRIDSFCEHGMLVRAPVVTTRGTSDPGVACPACEGGELYLASPPSEWTGWALDDLERWNGFADASAPPQWDDLDQANEADLQSMAA